MRRWIILAVAVCACQKPSAVVSEHESRLDGYLKKYAPYSMHFDASSYDDTTKTILKKLVEAAQILDTLYWMQTSEYGLHLRDSLASQDNPLAKKLLTLIQRNAGPFEQLSDYATFFGHQTYYAGHEIYPRGMTTAAFDSIVATLPDSTRQQFMSPYTVIREDGRGGYKAVPYHEAYARWITPITARLRESAALTRSESFAKFLRLKADALETDRYFDADVAWIDHEGPIDMVFGPFETYSDGIKAIKAKYEANIEVVDQEQSKKLDVYTKYLKEMEENLPVPAVYKSKVEGLTAKFVIVQEVIRTGEGLAGYQAVATNLPNDPEVHAKKGTKKTFWKNMFDARYNTIIRPVSQRLLDTAQFARQSADGFFQFVLMHEICHAVGPRVVKVGPKKNTPVNASIGPEYNGIEECKADVAGLHSLVYLMDKGVVDASREEEFWVSYLGSLFRSIRFGLNQAHGKAAFIELNYFLKNGGVRFDAATSKWKVDYAQIRNSIKKLAAELVVLLGDGDPGKTKSFVQQWTQVTPELQISLDLVRDIPIDVMPTYTITW